MKVLNFDGTIYEARTGSASQPSISFAGDTNTGIYSPGADQLAISTGGTGRLFVDASGRVGVGTSAPSSQLDIVGVGTPFGLLRVSNGTQVGWFGATSTTTGFWGSGVNTVPALAIGTSSNHPITFGTNNVGRVILDTSGNLGINTASPAGALNVQSSASDTWSAEGGGLVINGGNVSSAISTITTYYDDSSIRIGAGISQKTGLLITGQTSAAGSTVQFRTGNSERARIDSSGRLLVGTTSNSFGELLSLTTGGNTSNCGFFNFTSSDDRANTVIQHTRASGATSATMILFRNSSGTGVGSITATGSATSYVTSSDYRLKENVAAVTNGIVRLQQLKPSRFNFIADPDTVVDGFIAHEVQSVVPEAITGEKDAVDDDGNPVYQGIDQSKLVPLLTAALQEAVAKIESLEARLTAAGL